MADKKGFGLRKLKWDVRCGREPKFMDGDKRDFMGNAQTTRSTFAFSRDPLAQGECLNDFR